jgi:hypothetical protein
LEALGTFELNYDKIQVYSTTRYVTAKTKLELRDTTRYIEEY